MHIWGAKNRVYKKANLVLIHGFGGNSKWQFLLQIRQLARDFNVYVPDLVYFGESYSSKPDRSVGFQAKCVCDGLKNMRVDKFSVYAISYGGFVGYRMAEVYDDMVEKLVIVSSGINNYSCKSDRMSGFQQSCVWPWIEELAVCACIRFQSMLLVMVDLWAIEWQRQLISLQPLYNIITRFPVIFGELYDIGRWIPDFFLWGFIGLECCGREKEELVHELLNDKPDVDLQILTQ
ncbi:alpha/beta hydrolase fold-1, partial [Tanacetum coccineum]